MSKTDDKKLSIDDMFKVPMPEKISRAKEAKLAKIWNKIKEKSFN